jgi:hypothetical protein
MQAWLLLQQGRLLLLQVAVLQQQQSPGHLTPLHHQTLLPALQNQVNKSEKEMIVHL